MAETGVGPSAALTLDQVTPGMTAELRRSFTLQRTLFVFDRN